MPITSISPLGRPPAAEIRAPEPVRDAGSAEFGGLLRESVARVEGLRSSAGQAIERMLAGEGELHQVALAAQEAELAFELFLQVRNKVVQAYQEIMRMQV